MMRIIPKLWHRTEAGLLVPADNVSEHQETGRDSFTNVRDKVEKIEKLYRDNHLRIPSDCDLAIHIQNSQRLWRAWFLNDTREYSHDYLYSAIFINRLADAILMLDGHPKTLEYLRDMISGSLNFLGRDKSRAKSKLWEVELWARLKRKGIQARLVDPPDIIACFEDAEIGIACKKIYSERHVQNVLSEAVKQVEDNCSYGIVAMNADDIIPADKILRVSHDVAARNELARCNTSFIERHERHFRKYLVKGRLIAVMITINALVDIPRSGTSMNNVEQMTLWSIPSDELADNAMQARRFYNGIAA